MKKLAKSIYIKVPPVRLFLEDIEAIEEIYKENCHNYTIKTDDYEMSSIDDLFHLKSEKVFYLEFQSREPHITLTLSADDAKIHALEDNVINAGIVNKIQNILLKRVTPLRYFIGLPGVPLIIGLAVFSICFNILIFSPIFGGISPIRIIISVVMSLAMLISVFLNFKLKHSIISLKRSSSSKNFFVRHTDQILLLLTGGIIALIGQLIVRMIMDK